MSFFDKIEKIRNLPEMTRRRILVGTTFSITIVICIFWLSVRLYEFGSPTVSRAEEGAGPIAEAGEAIGNFLDSARQNIYSLGQYFNSVEASSSVGSNIGQ